MPRFRRSGLLVAVVLVLAAAPLLACSVPVFRFALERWPSDRYLAIVYHRGELTEEQQKAVDALGREGLAGEKFANLLVTTVDLDDSDIDPQLKEIGEAHAEEGLPRIVLRYPRQSGIALDAWSGPLTMESVQQIVDSPARAEISQRIVKGDSAVFLFLDSGDKKKDDKLFKLLQEEVAHQQKTLELPEIDPADVAQGFVTVPPESLAIKFSVYRLSRSDAQERVFVDMLLGTESDLRELDEPMVFPIFGRGRALYALVGKGINADNIAAAGAHLTGPCTCTIKQQNPGVDLITALDWEAVVEPIDDGKPQFVPTLSGFSDFSKPDAAQPDEAGDEAGDAESQEDSEAAADDEGPVSLAKAETESPTAETPQSKDEPGHVEASPFAARNILLFAVISVAVVGGAGLCLTSWLKQG